MTLLQRAVISRLHKAGQPAIAEEALAHWQLDVRVAGDAAADIRDTELRADFMKANAQATAH